MSNPIEDYALIGDGETAALVSRNGSVDWLCWPRFDGDACFAALLGNAGTRILAAPSEGSHTQRTSRRYQTDTLVMETDLETQDGAVRLIDFMPQRQGFPSLVRIVVGVRGSVAMRSELRLRFDYGSLPPWCEAVADGVVARVGPDLVVLRALGAAGDPRRLRAAELQRRGRRPPRLRAQPRPVFTGHSRADRRRGRLDGDADILARLDQPVR